MQRRGWAAHVDRRTSETIQSELIDLIQRGRVLEVVLNDIDVIGGGQQTGEGGGLGVP